MEAILRGLAIYMFLLIVFRLSGKRSLSEATTFDLVLLLIISETTQQAMVDNDHSLTNAAVLILTLIGTDIVLSVLKNRFRTLDVLLEGEPVVLVRDGEPLQQQLDMNRIDRGDLLEAARKQGLENMDQIKLAVLERGGEINVVPRGKG